MPSSLDIRHRYVGWQIGVESPSQCSLSMSPTHIKRDYLSPSVDTGVGSPSSDDRRSVSSNDVDSRFQRSLYRTLTLSLALETTEISPIVLHCRPVALLNCHWIGRPRNRARPSTGERETTVVLFLYQL